MSIRLPLKVVVSSDNSTEVGAGSVGGGVVIPVTLPQDTDNILVKFQASVTAGGVSAQFQTTDDGGTTWYGVARTSTVSNAIGDNAEWLSIPVAGYGVRPGAINASVVATGSVFSSGSTMGTIGSAQPSSLGMKSLSGMPVLSQTARILLQLTANVSATSVLLTEVKVNSQSATA